MLTLLIERYFVWCNAKVYRDEKIKLYEPKNCYLTFFGDSLIDKTNKQGMIRDAIPIMLNGEEVYL